MLGLRALTAATVGVAAVLATGFAAADGHGHKPKYGGHFTYVIPSKAPPSLDAHRETTYGVIHPVRPYYSTLLRVNPADPSSDVYVCDLCLGDVPEPTNGGKTYTFKLKSGVKFHDGTPLTSADVKASFDKIIFPPEGVSSARKSFYMMVDSVTTPDASTVVFNLKYASSAFIPALAAPYNFIYSKAKLDADIHWYEKNILGSGPFILDEYQSGAQITGTKNPNYYLKGLPYLDRITGVFANKESIQVQALRGNRASAQFRGFPPKTRDDLVKALGDKATVQETDWNCVLLATPNHSRKPFDDVRVRRALTLALDRWGGSEYLSKIAIVKTVGGIVYPKSKLAATKEELMQLDGYKADLEASRARARELLKEAGIDLSKTYILNNRAVDQPYKVVGVWLLDQWRQIGLNFEQQVKPTGPFYASLREKGDFDVSIDFNCQSIVNPPIDTSKYLSSDINPANYSRVVDRKMDELYNDMLLEADPAKQRVKMRTYEKYVLHDQVTQMITLWWFRTTVHRSHFKGWKISPSHYLGQALDTVWLDPDADK
jgi:peptide/nickel transport system substrate-binding protein